MREEIITNCRLRFSGLTDEDSLIFAIETAIYWFAFDYHSGQFSEGYALMCQSQYKPSPLTLGIVDEDESSKIIYEFLVDKYSRLI